MRFSSAPSTARARHVTMDHLGGSSNVLPICCLEDALQILFCLNLLYNKDDLFRHGSVPMPPRLRGGRGRGLTPIQRLKRAPPYPPRSRGGKSESLRRGIPSWRPT